MSGKKTFDDLMEAIAFAEAGELESARKIASDLFPGDTRAGRRGERILAVSGASGFSRRMIEDSVDMADRLDYGLVALSVVPALAKLVAKLGSRAIRAREESSLASAEAFRARAAERGIPFVHTVRSCGPARAVVEVRRSFRRIAFLVVQPDLTPRARFTGLNVPIVYLVDA